DRSRGPMALACFCATLVHGGAGCGRSIAVADSPQPGAVSAQREDLQLAGAREAGIAPESATELEGRVLRFSWRPPGARADDYSMSEPDDQHQLVLTRGVTPGGRYPVLIAFHGQPKTDEAPRTYAFPRVVADMVNDLVRRGEVEPLVLA